MTQNRQLAPITELSQQLAKKQTQLKSMLPEGMKVERFMRTVVNGIQMHSDKEKLLKANRESLFNSCSKAAADGLMLDGREATLVVFGSEVTYMPMTQGLVKLARNSGEISKIEAYIVYENDDFTYRIGIDSIPLFEPDWKIAPSKRGNPVIACAVIQIKDGDPIVRIMHAERIFQIAAGTRNANQYNPAKGNHYEEWWKKTVIKAALKYAPRSSELDAALMSDDDGYNFEAPSGHTEAHSSQAEVPMATVADINNDLDSEPKSEPEREPKSEPKPKPKAKPKTKPEPEQTQQAPIDGELVDDTQDEDDII